MKDSTWLILLGGIGLLVYFATRQTAAVLTPAGGAIPLPARSPLSNIMTRPTSPLPAGQQWQWNGFQWVPTPAGAIAF